MSNCNYHYHGRDGLLLSIQSDPDGHLLSIQRGDIVRTELWDTLEEAKLRAKSLGALCEEQPE